MSQQQRTPEEIRRRIKALNMKKLRLTNPEYAAKQRTNGKKWYQNNRQHDIEMTKKWNRDHPERKNQLNREHYHRHKKRIREQQNKYYAEHRDEINAKRRARNAALREKNMR